MLASLLLLGWPHQPYFLATSRVFCKSSQQVTGTTKTKDGHFNDVANWAYADLPNIRRKDRGRTAGPHDSMIFIEAVMDKYDAPQLAIDSGHEMADIDYGPAGQRTLCNSHPNILGLPQIDSFLVKAQQYQPFCSSSPLAVSP